MPTSILFSTPPALITLGSTALNSLGPAASSGVLDEFDNKTYRFPYGVFTLDLGAAYTCGANARCDIYLVYAIDDTNYPLPPSGTGAIPGDYWVGIVQGAASGATFTRGHSKRIPLLPFKFKPIVVNNLNSSGSWNATGNTLRFGRWSPEIQ